MCGFRSGELWVQKGGGRTKLDKREFVDMGALSLDRRIKILVRALGDSAKTCWNGSWKLEGSEDKYKVTQKCRN